MITAVIIAKNEEGMVQNALKSVGWVDEIIVIDNGSTDNTVKIAQEFTSHIISTDLDDLAKIRDLAKFKSKGEWLLYIDADERVTSDLKSEIIQITQLADSCSAYAISRKNIIFGQEVHYDPFWPDWVIRLIKKEKLENWVGKVHEYPKFDGELGYANNFLIHLTHRDLDQIVLKSLNWSKIDARLRLDAKHPKMNGLRLIRILFSELFNQGIIRKGFFNSTIGVADALLQTFSMVMTYIRLWQLQQKQSPGEIYRDIDKQLLDNKFKY